MSEVAPLPKSLFEVAKGWLAMLSLLLVPFIAYMELRQDAKAAARWESAPFRRTVEDIVRREISSAVEGMKVELSRLSDKIDHTTLLIERKIIE